VFVSFFDDSTGDKKSTLAYASACYLGGSSIKGRVIMGYVSFNLAFLKKSY